MKKMDFLFVLFFLILLGFKTVSYSQQKTFRIISYNVYEGMSKDTSSNKTVFSKWFKEKDPDVIAFQEMNRFTQSRLEEFARSYGHPYAVLLKENGYPVAITSKYPIVNTEKVIDNMHHGFIKATIKDITFFVVHLSPSKYWKRQEEVDLVLSTVSTGNKTKAIILGDFNAQSPQDSIFYKDGKMAAVQKLLHSKYPVYDNLKNGNLDYNVIRTVLSNGFTDPLYDSKKLNISFDAAIQGDPDLKDNVTRIDYILLGSHFKGKTKNAFIIRDEFTIKMSDHYPVFVELIY